MVNPYQPIAAKIEDIIDETPTIKTFVLKPDEPMVFIIGVQPNKISFGDEMSEEVKNDSLKALPDPL